MKNPIPKNTQKIYDSCGLNISNWITETESTEYDACQFDLNGKHIISRSGKVTPKKAGQFVTFWKRKDNGPIEPFHTSDAVDFFVVHVQTEGRLGQFVIPKSVLIAKGIISTDKKEGKRAFRVYTPWDEAKNKQAIQTQKWQLGYFVEMGSEVDFAKIKELYK